eukprot:m.49611 g.49611  ORF g.49611 m.49611 type:complete len:59 (-) comp7461_c2_seq1:96-272(-)
MFTLILQNKAQREYHPFQQRIQHQHQHHMVIEQLPNKTRKVEKAKNKNKMKQQPTTTQ